MKHVYELAEGELGVEEWSNGHNPKVVDYFREVGHSWVKDDETAWCAAFVGAMLKRAGLPHTGKLNARSYLDWGEAVPAEDAQLGDVVVFSRGDSNGWKGHVGFLDGFTSNGNIRVLGGNQKDKVCLAVYNRTRLLGFRRAEVSAPVDYVKELPKSKGFSGLLNALASLFRRRK